ncbi:hypothetical protein BMF94_3380 [Rhodotorula taiwanensis]|uniref:Core domain-containing protein n=1 Tax=Rhodotorula taiwanensis TaxID=741276 RepID=A0A2S5B9J3_9BASI|nr:hypothetical protein BMF94_3380 [Rhodotorula taiwanensis]
MTSTCRLCAAQLARTVSKPTAVARSTAVLASSSSPASNASRLVRRATPVSPWSPVRSMHSSPARASALLSATRSPRAPLLSSTRMSPRRNIACVAEAPENPSEDFEPVEEEMQEGERLEMHLTDAAIKQIERAQGKANDPTLALRLVVESGGCHGYQYKMQVTNKRDSDDYRFAPPIETTASLLVDSASLPLVKGSTIDYATELIGSAFRIRDNPQSKDAGCGCGVSWELKDM